MTKNTLAFHVESELPSSATLKDLNPKIPDREAVADWVVPDMTPINQDKLTDLHLSHVSHVSHVVLIISLDRQEQIMRQVGVRYDSMRPFPFWHFIGKIVSRALFGRDDGLEVMNYIAVRRTEYVAFTTRRCLDGEITHVNVVEVTFERPQPGSLMQCVWKPAGQLVVSKIHDWLDNTGFRPLLL
ncbi:hypothetical protein BBO_03435 [Beauveria brongniartii RCEF 3172]|uniref:Uncharacterized protein n=1 Tax=Beauveria brongniartii RCEF 3172 TaxID=1081107 RepID=A0A167FV95_9HYPO|nr:hypothetical protein BBO_03435 [Beauveria brongniartii RCEF 3172]